MLESGVGLTNNRNDNYAERKRAGLRLPALFLNMKEHTPIAERGHDFKVSIVFYYKPDKGKKILDYLVGPFDSDEAAFFWIEGNKSSFSKKSSYKLELTVNPTEEYYGQVKD